MITPADSAARVPEMHGVTAEQFAAEIAPGYRPVVMRGLVKDWPAVAAGQTSLETMADYILRFDQGRPIGLYAGDAAIGGRFFYRPDMRGFNFAAARVTVPLLIDRLLKEADKPAPAALYAGSSSATENFAGWADENRLPIGTPGATPRLWIGNASRVSAHYDGSSNVAAVAAGRRRFTLFPPEQAENLYVGPFEMTMAGQPTSMVDIEAPDLGCFPRFVDAATAMLVADLDPGDAIFVPALWWHEVRAIGNLNVLVNYWWGESTGGDAIPALIHAILAVRDLPVGEREAMRAWFDTWVFGKGASAAADHLPAHARGILAAPSPERDRVLREYLLRTLSR